METKHCPHCDETKPITSFYHNRSIKDGYGAYCKDCMREIQRAYKKTVKGKACAKRYAQSEKGKKAYARYHQRHKNDPYYRQQMKVANKAYRAGKVGKGTRRRRLYAYRKTHPLLDKARAAVRRAVFNGRLSRVSTQTCTVCGNQAQEYHHHNGYAKEHHLDVTPLCIRCHKAMDLQT